LSNAARVFTTHVRPMVTTQCRLMFTACSRPDFTTGNGSERHRVKGGG
jgi:hypothetical protein